MNQKIAEFPSRVMYYNKLRSHKSVASHLLDDLPGTSAESDEEAEEILRTPVVFIDTAGSEYYERVEGDHDEGSRCNENETVVVKKYIARLVCLGRLSNYICAKHIVPDRLSCPPDPNSCYHTVSASRTWRNRVLMENSGTRHR